MLTHIISTKLAGWFAVQRLLASQLVAVVAGGLVAMMSVGDEDRLWGP